MASADSEAPEADSGKVEEGAGNPDEQKDAKAESEAGQKGAEDQSLSGDEHSQDDGHDGAEDGLSHSGDEHSQHSQEAEGDEKPQDEAEFDDGVNSQVDERDDWPEDVADAALLQEEAGLGCLDEEEAAAALAALDGALIATGQDGEGPNLTELEIEAAAAVLGEAAEDANEDARPLT
eukprot:TRINITY_DN14644_c0_g1_i2.p1 TRINITY_DN14644_c0_g1~~TRINITY_DN14644_c0_g1_i2.p1  ORF type:complete len:178 (+),score=74.66 TRINITY_DN14644_c0_g1_i2:253-786(+)